jgi:hypothetical protein
MNEDHPGSTRRRIVLGVHDSEDAAQATLDELVEQDFPMDRVSLLGKAASPGDDPVGVYYPGTGARMKGWGAMGAFWGALLGLISGAAGMFLIPGLGPLLAAGPVVEALAGAAAGAGIGGGTLAGAAAISELTVAVHRMGVPEERLEAMRRHIEEGRYLLILIVETEQAARWREALERTGARDLADYPYPGLTEAIAER